MGYKGKITCSKCGAEYNLYETKLMMRDIDSEKCDICGTTLKSWNGGVMYSAKLIEKDSNNNVK